MRPFSRSGTGSLFRNLSMPYLIDANNLAGKLGLLGEKDFDQKTLLIVSGFALARNKKIILVFDGAGNLADTQNINVIYARGDYGFDSADEKMIDMIRFARQPEDYIVVTNDQGIIRVVEKLNEERNLRIKLERAEDFARRIRANNDARLVDEGDEKEELSAEEVDEINKELLKEWS
jgi:hypothetical protein